MELTNKVAVITGANSGIGRAITLALAKKGASVTIDYVVNEESAEELEKEIINMGDKAIMVDADVSKISDLQKLVDKTIKSFGKIDILVNNAGIETRTSVLDSSEEQYDKVMAVNLKSAFFSTQIAAKQMIKQGKGGRIINISSVHEDWPMPGNTPYCCSKGGMRMLTRTTGVELAKYGINVVGIGPGAVATPINTSTMSDPEKLQKLDSFIPIGRMAKPNEIASLVAWIASDDSSYVTAATFFVDGGIMQASPGL